MTIIARIKAAVRQGRYELTEHALEEAEADRFSPLDVRNAVLDGKLVQRYTHDRRGTRYKISGAAMDGRRMFVICRFTELRDVRIITIFAEDHED